MFKKSFLLPFLLVFIAIACTTTPVTNREALILVPFEQEVALGAQAYKESLSGKKESRDRRLREIVYRVGSRIAAVSDMPELNWEFKLVESKDQNAFCLPGGKVAVYTGILPVCESEAGLAGVIGHEVAHAIARHGAQRITNQLIVTGLLSAAAVSLADTENKDIILAALGVGTTVGVTLPFSRMNEAEADHIGLIYMARAGYDPREAPKFWERSHAQQQGSRTPAFLSTHPASSDRVQNLKKLVPEALREYDNAKRQYGLGERLVRATRGRR